MSARRFNRARRAALLDRLTALAMEQKAARACRVAIDYVRPMWVAQFIEATGRMRDSMERFAAAFTDAIRKMAESLAGAFVLPEGARLTFGAPRTIQVATPWGVAFKSIL